MKHRHAGQTHRTRRHVPGIKVHVGMNSRRRTILYSGRVQGVGFRWTAARCVAGLAIDGYVRNLVDGRVELVMEGEPEVLDTAAERLRDAMAGQIVDEAGASGLATGEFAGFRIQH